MKCLLICGLTADKVTRRKPYSTQAGNYSHIAAKFVATLTFLQLPAILQSCILGFFVKESTYTITKGVNLLRVIIVY